MLKDETISEFNVLLCDITNNSFALCEKMLDENLGRKILKYFSKRIHMKVTAIEEEKNFSMIKIDEMINYFLTFEMVIDDKFRKIK